jgi:hypothetical protein
LFINKNHTTVRKAGEISEDERIDAEIDFKSNQKRIRNEIKAQEKVIAEAEAAWRATE